MRTRYRPSAAALIAVAGLLGALVAPALVCGIGQACPMRAAVSSCVLPGPVEDCGGATLAGAPPACCAGQATAPAAALRDASAPRTERTSDLTAVVILLQSVRPSADIRLVVQLPVTTISPRDPLSLSNTLLL